MAPTHHAVVGRWLAMSSHIAYPLKVTRDAGMHIHANGSRAMGSTWTGYHEVNQILCKALLQLLHIWDLDGTLRTSDEAQFLQGPLSMDFSGGLCRPNRIQKIHLPHSLRIMIG